MEIPDECLFDAWHQATSPLFDVEPIQDFRSYHCSATSYLVDQLIFNQTAFDGMQFIRPSQKLSGSQSDCITLQYYATGRIQGSLENGTPLVMEPNRISIQDFAHAYSGLGETTNNFGIIIPRHLINVHDQIYKKYPMFSWEVTSPQGRLLISALNYRLFKRHFGMTPSEARDLVLVAPAIPTEDVSGQWEDINRLRRWLERY